MRFLFGYSKHGMNFKKITFVHRICGLVVSKESYIYM